MKGDQEIPNGYSSNVSFIEILIAIPGLRYPKVIYTEIKKEVLYQ
jgi:hypothetical protein